MAMTPEEKRRLSSLMKTSALSPDYNKEEATAALEAMMREGNQLDLPSKPISTTAGAPVDPRAAVGRGLSIDPVLHAVKNPLDATKSALYTVTGETMPFLQGAATAAAANIGDTANTLLLGMPVSDKMDKDFVLARDIVKRDLERATMMQPVVAEHAMPGALAALPAAILAGAPATLPALAARYTVPRLAAAFTSGAAESMMSQPSEYGKITNPKDLLNPQTLIEAGLAALIAPGVTPGGAKIKLAGKADELAKAAELAARQAFEKNANRTITKFKVVDEPPNPHLGRDIADIETELKQVNTKRAQTQRSGGDKDALNALNVQRKLLLEAQAIKRPEIATAAAKLAEKESAKDDVFTEKGHTAYMSDEQIEAAAVAREAAIAKKKKKGGGGEGEGGAGGDSGGGGPRDDGGGSGLSSALKATEDKTIDPETQLPFTDELIKRKEITRETTKTPAIRRILREGEVENDDVELAATIVAEAIKQTKDGGKYAPKSGLKNEQLSTMPVRDAEWFRRRQGEDANADANDALRRQNNPIPEGKVTPEKPKPKYTDEEVANIIKDNPRGADEGIIEHRIRIYKIIDDNKKNLEAAIRSMPDDMLTPGERLKREQAPRTPSNDQRVALYAPEAGGPDTRLPLGPVDDGGMRMSDTPRGGGNRTPDIDPEEVRSAALAAIQLERAAAEAAAELPPSVKLERALAEKEYEKQFSPERAAEAAKKVESEAFWTSRPYPDEPLGVDEANDIIRTGVKGKIHPFLAEPLAAAEGADKGYQLALKDWYDTVKIANPNDPKATAVVEQLLLIDSGLAPVARSQKLKYLRGPDRVEKYVRKNEFGDGAYGRTYSVVDRNGKPKVAKISYHTGANYAQAHRWEKNVARAIQNVAANATPAEKSLYLKHFPKFEQILERPDDPGGYIIVMDELRPMRKDEELELFKGRKALREKLKEKGFLNAEQTDDLPKQDFILPYEHNMAARPTYGAMRKVLTADDYDKMSPRVRSFYKALEYMSDVHGIHWGDMHEGNVMIDSKTGNYVASDTGLFQVVPRSHPYYSSRYTKEQEVAEAAGRAARQGDVAALADELSGETERLAAANPAEKELFKRARERGLELKAVQDAKREERLREAARQLLIQQGLVRPKGK